MQPTSFVSSSLHPGRVAGLAHPLPTDVVVGEIWGQKAIILLALIASPRTADELMRLVYGADKGPPSARKCIHVAIFQLRDRLRPGWRIGNIYRPGLPQLYILRRA